MRTSATSSSAAVTRQRRDRSMQIMRGGDERGIGVGVRVGAQRPAQLRRPFVVHAVDQEVDEGQLYADPYFGEVADVDATAREVNRDHVGHRRRARRRDEEAAARAAPHGRNLVMLEDTHRLPEDGPADFVPFGELGLGAKQLARLQGARHDVAKDAPCDPLSALVAGRPGHRDAGAEGLSGRAPAPEERGLRFEVGPHAPARGGLVAGEDRVGDARVSVGRLTERRDGERLRVVEVEQRDPVEDVDEQFEHGIPGHRRQEHVQRPVIVDLPLRLRVDEGAQSEEIRFVETSRRQAGDDLFERDSGLEHLVEAGADAMAVEHGCVDDRVDGRLADDEAPARSPAHAGDLLVLDQPYRFAEDGPAHPVPFQELGFGAEDLADRPVPGHDIGEDLGGYHGRELRSGLVGQRHPGEAGAR